MSSTLDLSNLQTLGFYALTIVPLLLFSRWQLGLTRSVVSGLLRMTVQLAVVGLYLQTLFDLANVGLNMLWLLVMLVVASWSICQRAKINIKRVLPAVLGGLAVSLLVVLPILLAGVIQAKPWWQAQYMIPVAGMLLGNCLTANVVAMERWYGGLKEQYAEFQYYLTLGSPAPLRPFNRKAVLLALSPQIAGMSTLGIVSLPGMMTGQILGGTAPMLAVKYQLIIMVAIFIAAAVSVITSLAIVNRYAFDPYGRLTI